MCETTWKPDAAIEEQLEQLLHNVSTWRDATDVICDTQVLSGSARLSLAAASRKLEEVRDDIRAALYTTAYANRTLQEG